MGYSQILWLYGPNYEVTEVGTMNMFVALKNKDGKYFPCSSPILIGRVDPDEFSLRAGQKELITAPTPSDGVVLSGVTRDSIIQLVRKMPGWNVVERYAFPLTTS